jgi:hypothetical protein
LKVTGVSWTPVRLFSGFLTAILGVLIYEHVSHETRNCIAGVSAVTLFSSSTLVIAWYPLAKTFSLAGLFLFCAYVMVSRISPASSLLFVVFAGLVFGLSVDTRAYLAGVIPVFLWWLSYKSAGKHISQTLGFLCGFALGLVPSLYLFSRSPDIYMFNNLGYHAIRSHAGLVGDWRAKLNIVHLLLSGADNNGFQFSMVAAIAFVCVGLLRARRDASFLALLIALVLGCISILPTPALVQYYCLCVPFLIVAAVCSVKTYLGLVSSPFVKRAMAIVLGALLVSFVELGISGFQNYLITGNHVLGIRGAAEAPNWTLSRVRAVSQAIDELAVADEEIGSFWSGYIFQSKARPYPGFENEWGRAVSSKLTSEERAKYHIVSDPEVEAGFAAHLPRIVVLGNQEILWASPQVSTSAGILVADGYTLAREIGNARIYVWSPRP